MVLSLVITGFGVAFLLYAIYQIKKISTVLLEAHSRRTLVNVIVLFFLLLSTYLGFSMLFTLNFNFHNAPQVISLVLFLSAIYIAIFTNLAVVVKDISTTKIERLRDANKRLKSLSKDKDEFVKVTAHELRIPLLAIRNSVKALRKPRLDKAKQKEHLQGIASEIQRLDTQVSDMAELAHLDFSSITLNPSFVRPSEILKGLKDQLELIAERKNIRASFRVIGSDDIFKTDVLRVNQLLAKLFVNAMHHSPDGGTIIVACDRSPKQVEFRVSDEGPVVPKAQLPHLFKEFCVESAAEGGVPRSCLVLAICKKLVEAMGGTIGAESTEERGTTFYFVLPLKIPAKLK